MRDSPVHSIAFLGHVADPEDIVRLAQKAEETGWDAVWMVEYEYDTFAFDQAIAMNTLSLITGSCISRSFTKHPLLVAETATVIDRFAPGRFVIGLGVGGVTEPKSTTAEKPSRAARETDALALQRWGMASDRPVRRMREYVEIVRLALKGEPLSYSGECFQFEDVQLTMSPSRPLQIFLGARGRQMLRLAGEIADGVFLWLVGEQATAESMRELHAGAAVAGRDSHAVSIGCLIPTCVADDGSVARRAMRRHLVDFYLGRAAYKDVLARCGFPDVAERVAAAASKGDFDAASEAIPEEALDQIALSGTPADCREGLHRWLARGIEVPVIYAFPVGSDWASAYEYAIEELRPSRLGPRDNRGDR